MHLLRLKLLKIEAPWSPSTLKTAAKVGTLAEDLSRKGTRANRAITEIIWLVTGTSEPTRQDLKWLRVPIRPSMLAVLRDRRLK